MRKIVLTFAFAFAFFYFGCVMGTVKAYASDVAEDAVYENEKENEKTIANEGEKIAANSGIGYTKHPFVLSFGHANSLSLHKPEYTHTILLENDSQKKAKPKKKTRKDKKAKKHAEEEKTTTADLKEKQKEDSI